MCWETIKSSNMMLLMQYWVFNMKRVTSHKGYCQYLRNRKHAPCFYRVIETWVEDWENEKCCGNTSHRWVFPQLFWVLPNFHECFYNSTETQRTRFLFLLENTATKRKKINLLNLIIKMYILFARYIITSRACASSVFLSSYRNTIFNQSVRIFS